MRRFTSIGFSCTSSPHTVAAPLGPRNPSTSPLPTSKETPSTARFDPKDLLRFSTLITAPLQNIYTDRHWLAEVPWPGRRNRILAQPGFGHKQMTNDHQPAPSRSTTKAL